MKQLLITFLLSAFLAHSAFAQRDTFALYQMGAIERIEGLSYGSSHSITLFTDSTFVYHVAHGNQISISSGVAATGNWCYHGDTLCLEEQGQTTQRFDFFNNGYRDTREDLRLWFYFNESIQSFNLPVLSIYGQDSTIQIPLQMETGTLPEEYQRLQYPIPYLRVELEVDLATLDSISLFGVTLIPEEKNYNELSFYCTPAFNVKFIAQAESLRIVGEGVPESYRFRRVR